MNCMYDHSWEREKEREREINSIKIVEQIFCICIYKMISFHFNDKNILTFIWVCGTISPISTIFCPFFHAFSHTFSFSFEI